MLKGNQPAKRSWGRGSTREGRTNDRLAVKDTVAGGGSSGGSMNRSGAGRLGLSRRFPMQCACDAGGDHYLGSGKF